MSENVTAAKAAKAPAATFGGRGLTIGIAAAAAVTIVGLVLWGMQLAGGFMDTAMRDFAPWGINIALFMFFVGLSVGSMVVAASPRAFGFESFGGIAKMAAWVPICSTVLAIGFVVVDLGQPLRLWELFAYSNLSSPLMWDIIVLSVYLILSVVYLWTLLRAEKRQASAKALRIVSAVVLLWALVVCAVDGWIFGLMPSRALWNTALLAPWFVSSALASGAALVLVLAIALRRTGYVDVREEHVARLAKLLGAFVCVDLFFFACDLVTEGFPGGSGAGIVGMLVAGQLAPFFWIQIVGCALAAVVCFVPKLRTSPLLVAAGLADGRGRVLQAHAAGRGRLPGSLARLCHVRHPLHRDERLGRRSGRRLRGHGLRAHASRGRARSRRAVARRAPRARGPEVPAALVGSGRQLARFLFERAPIPPSGVLSEDSAKEGHDEENPCDGPRVPGRGRVRAPRGRRCRSVGGPAEAHRGRLPLSGGRLRFGVVPRVRRRARAGRRP